MTVEKDESVCSSFFYSIAVSVTEKATELLHDMRKETRE